MGVIVPDLGGIVQVLWGFGTDLGGYCPSTVGFWHRFRGQLSKYCGVIVIDLGGYCASIVGVIVTDLGGYCPSNTP